MKLQPLIEVHKTSNGSPDIRIDYVASRINPFATFSVTTNDPPSLSLIERVQRGLEYYDDSPSPEEK